MIKLFIESLAFTFNPILSNECEIFMDKMGELVSPMDVVLNGSIHLHSVQKGLLFNSSNANLFIQTIDSPLTCLGSLNPFPIPLSGTPNWKDEGISFILSNK